MIKSGKTLNNILQKLDKLDQGQNEMRVELQEVKSEVQSNGEKFNNLRPK
ncbi:hypothetical protein ACI2OX_06930 [Bacillus sp. N9]